MISVLDAAASVTGVVRLVRDPSALRETCSQLFTLCGDDPSRRQGRRAEIVRGAEKSV
jgi:hypothetical protein